jgi:hypothetical protein
MAIMEFVKAHPVPVGLGVVVILLIVFSRGSSPASNNAAQAGNYLQAQSIAANSNTRLAEIGMTTTIAQGAQSVDNNRIAAVAAGERTGAIASLFATMVGTNAQVQMNNSGNLLKSTQSLYAHQENLVGSANALDAAKTSINANIRMNADQLQTQVRLSENDINGKLSALGMQTSGDLQMLKQLGVNQTDAMKTQGSITSLLMDKNIATLPTLLQHSETMLKISGENAYGLMDLQTSAARTKSRADARNEDAKTAGTWIGNVAKVFAMFA